MKPIIRTTCKPIRDAIKAYLKKYYSHYATSNDIGKKLLYMLGIHTYVISGGRFTVKHM